jgi:nucleotide-binding universal stress UspA family protein
MGQQSSLRHLSGQQLADLLRQHAASYLAERAKELGAAGISAETLLGDGLPAEQIIEAAEHNAVRLIAMATHGYSGLRRWALGSVADKVVHAAPCPVFLARAGAHPPTNPWSVKRILVPLDGSTIAEQALPLAIELARNTQAEIILLQVLIPLAADAPGLAPFARLVPPSFAFPDTLREQAHQQLGAVADHAGMHGLKITPVVVFGFPAEEIVDEATRHQADLIVMATHGYGGLRRWALGSVADKVLHATTTPLVLVRAV